MLSWRFSVHFYKLVEHHFRRIYRPGIGNKKLVFIFMNRLIITVEKDSQWIG